MNIPASEYLFFDRIEGTADIIDKSYEQHIRYIVVFNDSDKTMILSSAGQDISILAGKILSFPVYIEKFSLYANGGSYRIDVRV
jgi:hypothetical protein